MKPRISPKLLATVPRDLIDEAIASHLDDLAKEDTSNLSAFVTDIDFHGVDDAGRKRKWHVRVVTNLSTRTTRAATKEELPVAKPRKGPLH